MSEYDEQSGACAECARLREALIEVRDNAEVQKSGVAPHAFARVERIARAALAAAPCAECAPAASPLSAPFTSPAFWTCPVCGSGAAERVESCEGFVDIADPEEGETEDVDARHPIVYRPEYVERLRANCARLREALAWALDEISFASRDDTGGVSCDYCCAPAQRGVVPMFKHTEQCEYARARAALRAPSTQREET